MASAAPPVKKLPAVNGAGSSKSAAKPGPTAAAGEPVKYKYSGEEADALAADLIPEQIAADLGDANWKVRLAALDEFSAWLDGGVAESAECEVLFRSLSKRPGWNEKNFQVNELSLLVFESTTLI